MGSAAAGARAPCCTLHRTTTCHHLVRFAFVEPGRPRCRTAPWAPSTAAIGACSAGAARSGAPCCRAAGVARRWPSCRWPEAPPVRSLLARAAPLQTRSSRACPAPARQGNAVTARMFIRGCRRACMLFLHRGPRAIGRSKASNRRRSRAGFPRACSRLQSTTPMPMRAVHRMWLLGPYLATLVLGRVALLLEVGIAGLEAHHLLARHGGHRRLRDRRRFSRGVCVATSSNPSQRQWGQPPCPFELACQGLVHRGHWYRRCKHACA